VKILLVQTSFLGDVVLSTPVIARLRALYPQAEIWFMGTRLGVQVVAADPHLSGTIIFDKRGSSAGIWGLLRMRHQIAAHAFDRVYSLHRSLRTSVLLWLTGIPTRIGFREARASFLYTHRVTRNTGGHEVQRNLSLLQTVAQNTDASDELRLFIDQSKIENPKIIELLKVPQFAVLVPGSAWHTKAWHWERYRELGIELSKMGRVVAVLGAAQEAEVCQKVCADTSFLPLGGQTSIAEFMAVIKAASWVVCNDSFALHVASAFKRNTIAAFCATSPQFGFGPWQNEHAKVIEVENLACKPCRRHGSRICPTGTEACMRELKAEVAVTAMAQMKMS
jgi:heptosyltransferase-2